MGNFQSEFEVYGANYQAVMDRLMGNEALYLKLLKMLSGDGSAEQLGAALESGDLDAAFEAAHTLKGVAGNLGLDPLSQAVKAIVEPLRSRQHLDYAPLYQAIRLELQRAETFRAALEEVARP